MNHQGRGTISQGANKPEGESARHKGRISQGVNEPGSEQARRQTGKWA